MAKKKAGPSKSALIKEELAKDPNASPSGIADKLKEHDVTAAYVSNIKQTMKAGSKSGGKSRPAAKRKKKAARAASTAPAAKSDKVSVDDLVKAKKLADELGGVDVAKQMLDAVAKLS